LIFKFQITNQCKNKKSLLRLTSINVNWTQKPFILIERLQEKNKTLLLKREAEISRLTDDQILLELKNKGLATFGTKQERLERLKRHYGIY
jgi:hypothetical protein